MRKRGGVKNNSKEKVKTGLSLKREHDYRKHEGGRDNR